MAAPIARADMVGGDTILGTFRDTSSANDWMVKYLGGPNTGSGFTGEPNETFDWGVHRSYNDGILDTTGYNQANGISTSTAKGLGWNTQIDWVSSSSTGKGSNGFYSYVTTIEDIFSLGNNQSLAFNGLSLNFASDDHMQAILINGVDIGYGPEASNHPGWIQNYFNVSLDDIAWNISGLNTIEFVVHNVNWDIKDQYYATSQNATGLSANIQAIYMVDENEVPNVTPEPATLVIIGIGLAGLVGLVEQRRRHHRS